ncbi:hypothetical protein GCM10009737_32950 [Nocardioides lentus]|uniref:Signal peptidase I n=1 Tax=Nocardioides lentus TaxID=338077 RepID=A0ABP5B2M9_9ACTN
MSIAITPRRTTEIGRHRGAARRRADAAPARTAPRGLSRASGAAGAARVGVRLVGWVVLGAVVAVFCFLAVGPHVLGYRTATMLTGSMEPMIAPGDVVVSVPKPVDEVEVGDVISYHIPVEDHRVETHRVIGVTTSADGRPVVQTKGDNNDNKDPWTATLEGDEVWETVHVVPHLGSAIRALRAPVVQTYVLWGAVAGLLVMGLAGIWRHEDTDEDTDEGTDRDTDDDTDDADPIDGPVGAESSRAAAGTPTIMPSSARPGADQHRDGGPRGT